MFPGSEAKTACIERFSAGSENFTVEFNSWASITKWAWELKFFKLPLLSINYFCTYNDAATKYFPHVFFADNNQTDSKPIKKSFQPAVFPVAQYPS